MSKVSNLLGDIPKNNKNEEKPKQTSFVNTPVVETHVTAPVMTNPAPVVSDPVPVVSIPIGPTHEEATKKEKKTDGQQISFYMPKEIYQVLKAKSVIEGKTQATICNEIIKNALEKEKTNIFMTFNQQYNF